MAGCSGAVALIQFCSLTLVIFLYLSRGPTVSWFGDSGIGFSEITEADGPSKSASDAPALGAVGEGNSNNDNNNNNIINDKNELAQEAADSKIDPVEAAKVTLGKSILEPIDWSQNKIVQYFQQIQADCTMPVWRVSAKFGGGFASRFQWIVIHAMQGLHKGRAVRIDEHIGAYTGNDYCKQVLGPKIFSNGSFTCYFEPITDCPDDSVPVGNGKSETQEARNFFMQPMDVTSQEVGDIFMALQTYFFRLKPEVHPLIHEREAAIGFNPDAKLQLAALHIRRGDKVSDAYNRYHTALEYIQPLYSYALSTPTCRASLSDTVMQVFVASDSPTALGEVHAHLDNVRAGRCSFEVIGTADSVTQNKSSHGSGDKTQMMSVMGRLQFEEQREAMMDILFDIYMLSRASLLVGTFFSQVGRMGRALHVYANYPDIVGEPPIALDYAGWRTAVGFKNMGMISVLPEGWRPVDPEDDSYNYAPGGIKPKPVLAPELDETYDAIVALQAHCPLPEKVVVQSSVPGIGPAIRETSWDIVKTLKEGKRVNFTNGKGAHARHLCTNVHSPTCLFASEGPCKGKSDELVGPRAPKMSADRALEIIRQQTDEDLLMTVEAWLTRPIEELKAQFIAEGWLSMAKRDGYPVFALSFSDKEKDFSKHVEAILAWAKTAKLQQIAQNTHVSTITCNLAVADQGGEVLKKFRTTFKKKKEGACSFAVQQVDADVARADAKNAMFAYHVFTNADHFIGSSSDPTSQIAAELRRARFGKAARSCTATIQDGHPVLPKALPQISNLWTDLQTCLDELLREIPPPPRRLQFEKQANPHEDKEERRRFMAPASKSAVGLGFSHEGEVLSNEGAGPEQHGQQSSWKKFSDPFVIKDASFASHLI